MTLPRVTVSLVTYNGANWLPGCLASLDAQTMTDFELLVLDNASADGTRAILRAWVADHLGAVLSESATNLGYAAAHNRNIDAARGDVVLLLNQDVELDAGFLAAAVSTLDARPQVGALQPRLRRLEAPGERLASLDTTGLQMGRDRRPVSRDQGRIDDSRASLAGPVWGVDGPAPVYRRVALRGARLPRQGGGWEVLDEDFFLYKEDVDLAWRLGLLGWTSWYEPAALGWHARGTGGTGATSLLDIARTNRTIRHEAKALSWRNQRLMQIKNEAISDYLRDLPWIMRRELLSISFILLFDPPRLSAIPALLRAAPAAMRKRRYLQARIRRGRAGCGRHAVASSRRRRIYDRLPSAFRKPARDAYARLLDARTRVGHRRVSSDAQRLPVPSSDGRRGTLLLVDDQVPEHDIHAGALTTFHYLAILRDVGLRVIFKPDDGVRREPYATELERLGVQVLSADVELSGWLSLNGSMLDRVLLSRPIVARRHLRSVRRHTDAQVLYLAHDLHFLREERRFDTTRDPEALRQSRHLLEIETDLFESVDTVLTFSPDEVPEIERVAPGTRVRVVTPAFYIDAGNSKPARSARPMAERHEVLFVGAYDHAPNVDAVQALVKEVMPLVWSSEPDVHVTLIGGHVGDEVAALASERVTVAGQVPDLDPYWDDARLTLSPLRFGSGVKGKVIASLEAGVPVVTTPIGNEGIGLVSGREALIGESSEELATHVLALLGDAAMAEALAAAGREVLEQRFSRNQVRRDLLAALGLGMEVSAS